jgi:hypothetical protein
MDTKYTVRWERSALRQLGQLYKIDHEKVYKTSLNILSRNPHGQSYGSADYTGFEFNGYHWSYIQNAIVLYRISEKESIVFVEACYHANTGWALKVFYGEYDPWGGSNLMEWTIIREQYPERWVLVEALQVTNLNDNRIINDMFVISDYEHSNQVWSAYKEHHLTDPSREYCIFHTSNENVEVIIQPFRRGLRHVQT